MDVMTKQQRHNCMARIKGKNTKPELIVRRFLWSHGLRYRINYSRLPGKPDLVLTKYRTVIFVNGCFWHGHDGCRYYTHPKTHPEFWEKKVRRNRERDALMTARREARGWSVITVWECEVKKARLEATIAAVEEQLHKNLQAWEAFALKRTGRDRL